MKDNIFKNFNITPTSKPKKIEDDKVVTPNIIHKYLTGSELDVPSSELIEKKPTPTTTSKRTSLHKNSTQPATTPETQKKIDDLLTSQLNIAREKFTLDKPKVEKKEDPGLPGVEYEEHLNISFMKSFTRHEMKHKHHSGLIIAKRCLREYFYSQVINRVIAEDTNIFFPWGTACHLYKQRLNELYGYGDETPLKFDNEKAKNAHKEAARVATEYWLKNGQDQKADSKYDWFTSERLYRSLVKLYEFWVTERKLGKIKILAVEQFFNVELSDGSFREGIIDEAVEYNGELWGRDLKTTSKPEEWFIRQFTPNNQVRQYSFGNSKLAGRPVRGLIIQGLYNAKSTKKGDKGPDVFEKLVEVTDYELQQWEREQVVWNQILDLCREKDIWPQSEVSCSWCDYYQVCIKPSEAAMVYTLENKYVKKLRDPYNSGVSDE